MEKQEILCPNFKLNYGAMANTTTWSLSDLWDIDKLK